MSNIIKVVGADELAKVGESPRIANDDDVKFGFYTEYELAPGYVLHPQQNGEVGVLDAQDAEDNLFYGESIADAIAKGRLVKTPYLDN